MTYTIPPEDVAKIEAVLTMIADGHKHRDIIIEHNILDLTSFMYFLKTLRTLGVRVPVRGKIRQLSRKDEAQYTRWLQAKRASAEAITAPEGPSQELAAS